MLYCYRIKKGNLKFTEHNSRFTIKDRLGSLVKVINSSSYFSTLLVLLPKFLLVTLSKILLNSHFLKSKSLDCHAKTLSVLHASFQATNKWGTLHWILFIHYFFFKHIFLMYMYISIQRRKKKKKLKWGKSAEKWNSLMVVTIKVTITKLTKKLFCINYFQKYI